MFFCKQICHKVSSTFKVNAHMDKNTCTPSHTQTQTQSQTHTHLPHFSAYIWAQIYSIHQPPRISAGWGDSPGAFKACVSTGVELHWQAGNAIQSGNVLSTYDYLKNMLYEFGETVAKLQK